MPRYTENELRIIRKCNTPEKVQKFLLSLDYAYEGGKERFRSFRMAAMENTADCVEGALVAAALMSAHGYPPIVVDLEARNDWDHVLFIYRKNGKYGSIALSRDPNLYGRKPKFSSIRDLVMSYYKPYFTDGGWIHSFAVVNLDDSGIDWRFSKKDIFVLEKFLNSCRHERLKYRLEPFVIRKIFQIYYCAVRWLKRKVNRARTIGKRKNVAV